jgi:hypothetical protein
MSLSELYRCGMCEAHFPKPADGRWPDCESSEIESRAEADPARWRSDCTKVDRARREMHEAHETLIFSILHPYT